MQYKAYGKETGEKIVLLHGGGLSWWNYREVAEQLAADYHVILPILDGHNQSDAPFTSIEDNAARMIEFIETQLGAPVLLLGGLSLGGQIVLEMLAQNGNICRYALIESAQVIPSKLTHMLIEPLFGSCYGLIKHKWFSKWQSRSLRIKEALFADYYRDTCGITKANMIAFLKANTGYCIKPSAAASAAKAYVFVGGRESGSMRKSAALIHRALPESTLQVHADLHHGAFSLNHAEAYAQTVRQITGQLPAIK